MLSTNKNFLFIHVPKTAGNSISLALNDYSDDKIIEIDETLDTFEIKNDKFNTTKHSSLSYYKSILDEEVYNKLYKFCVVRNPWEMAVSYYFSPHWKKWEKYHSPEKWDIDNFIKLLDFQILPLRHYICTSDNNNLSDEMNNIIRFENLENEFNEVLNELGIKNNKLMHKNKSNHDDYRVYYTDDLKDIVYNKFKEEINFFNYEF